MNDEELTQVLNLLRSKADPNAEGRIKAFSQKHDGLPPERRAEWRGVFKNEMPILYSEWLASRGGDPA